MLGPFPRNSAPAGASGRARHRSTPQNPRNSGSGKAEFTFDTDQGTVCYELEVEGIAEPVEPAPGVGSAHIHFLATGGIAVDLEAGFQPDQSDAFKASGCVVVDSALLQAILENPDQFYVNIHNVEFPGGRCPGCSGDGADTTPAAATHVAAAPSSRT